MTDLIPLLPFASSVFTREADSVDIKTQHTLFFTQLGHLISLHLVSSPNWSRLSTAASSSISHAAQALASFAVATLTAAAVIPDTEPSHIRSIALETLETLTLSSKSPSRIALRTARAAVTDALEKHPLPSTSSTTTATTTQLPAPSSSSAVPPPPIPPPLSTTILPGSMSAPVSPARPFLTQAQTPTGSNKARSSSATLRAALFDAPHGGGASALGRTSTAPSGLESSAGPFGRSPSRGIFSFSPATASSSSLFGATGRGPSSRSSPALDSRTTLAVETLRWLMKKTPSGATSLLQAAATAAGYIKEDASRPSGGATSTSVTIPAFIARVVAVLHSFKEPITDTSFSPAATELVKAMVSTVARGASSIPIALIQSTISLHRARLPAEHAGKGPVLETDVAQTILNTVSPTAAPTLLAAGYDLLKSATPASLGLDLSTSDFLDSVFGHLRGALDAFASSALPLSTELDDSSVDSSQADDAAKRLTKTPTSSVRRSLDPFSTPPIPARRSRTGVLAAASGSPALSAKSALPDRGSGDEEPSTSWFGNLFTEDPASPPPSSSRNSMGALTIGPGGVVDADTPFLFAALASASSTALPSPPTSPKTTLLRAVLNFLASTVFAGHRGDGNAPLGDYAKLHLTMDHLSTILAVGTAMSPSQASEPADSPILGPSIQDVESTSSLRAVQTALVLHNFISSSLQTSLLATVSEGSSPLYIPVEHLSFFTRLVLHRSEELDAQSSADSSATVDDVATVNLLEKTLSALWTAIKAGPDAPLNLAASLSSAHATFIITVFHSLSGPERLRFLDLVIGYVIRLQLLTGGPAPLPATRLLQLLTYFLHHFEIMPDFMLSAVHDSLLIPPSSLPQPSCLPLHPLHGLAKAAARSSSSRGQAIAKTWATPATMTAAPLYSLNNGRGGFPISPVALESLLTAPIHSYNTLASSLRSLLNSAPVAFEGSDSIPAVYYASTLWSVAGALPPLCPVLSNPEPSTALSPLCLAHEARSILRLARSSELQEISTAALPELASAVLASFNGSDAPFVSRCVAAQTLHTLSSLGDKDKSVIQEGLGVGSPALVTTTLAALVGACRKYASAIENEALVAAASSATVNQSDGLGQTLVNLSVRASAAGVSRSDLAAALKELGAPPALQEEVASWGALRQPCVAPRDSSIGFGDDSLSALVLNHLAPAADEVQLQQHALLSLASFAVDALAGLPGPLDKFCSGLVTQVLPLVHDTRFQFLKDSLCDLLRAFPAPSAASALKGSAQATPYQLQASLCLFDFLSIHGAAAPLAALYRGPGASDGAPLSAWSTQYFSAVAPLACSALSWIDSKSRSTSGLKILNSYFSLSSGDDDPQSGLAWAPLNGSFAALLTLVAPCPNPALVLKTLKFFKDLMSDPATAPAWQGVLISSFNEAGDSSWVSTWWIRVLFGRPAAPPLLLPGASAPSTAAVDSVLTVASLDVRTAAHKLLEDSCLDAPSKWGFFVFNALTGALSEATQVWSAELDFAPFWALLVSIADSQGVVPEVLTSIHDLFSAWVKMDVASLKPDQIGAMSHMLEYLAVLLDAAAPASAPRVAFSSSDSAPGLVEVTAEGSSIGKLETPTIVPPLTPSADAGGDAGGDASGSEPGVDPVASASSATESVPSTDNVDSDVESLDPASDMEQEEGGSGHSADKLDDGEDEDVKTPVRAKKAPRKSLGNRYTDLTPDPPDMPLHQRCCTYRQTGEKFAEQHWYYCYTCSLTNNSGACSLCVLVCHAGHDVVYTRKSSFFCDCGHGGGCQALVPRPAPSSSSAGAKDDDNASQSETATPAGADGKPSDLSAFLAALTAARESMNNLSTAVSPPVPDQPSSSRSRKSKSKKSRSSIPSPVPSLPKEPVKASDVPLLPIPKPQAESFEVVRAVAESAALTQTLIDVQALLQTVWSRNLSQSRSSTSDEDDPAAGKHASPAGRVYASGPKATTGSSRVLEGRCSFKANSLEGKLKFDSGRGPDLNRALDRGYVTRHALDAASVDRVFIAEQDKMAVVDLTTMFNKSGGGTLDKGALRVLSRTTVPMEIVSVRVNPTNKSYVAVAGIKDVMILNVSPSGTVGAPLIINLMLDVLGDSLYVVDVVWIPGSQVKLAVITNAFVKVYDASSDVICPIHYFQTLDDPITGAVFVPPRGSTELTTMVVLTSSGMMFTQYLFDASDGGACILTEVIPQPPEIRPPIPDKEYEGAMSTGGRALTYWPEDDLLLWSDSDGHAFAGRLNASVTEFEAAWPLFSWKPGCGARAPVDHFTPVAGQQGAFMAIGFGGATLFGTHITSSAIASQQWKLPSSSSRVAGMTTLAGKGSQGRSSVVLFLEDGSLSRVDVNPTPVEAVAGSGALNTPQSAQGSFTSPPSNAPVSAGAKAGAALGSPAPLSAGAPSIFAAADRSLRQSSSSHPSASQASKAGSIAGSNQRKDRSSKASSVASGGDESDERGVPGSRNGAGLDPTSLSLPKEWPSMDPTWLEAAENVFPDEVTLAGDVLVNYSSDTAKNRLDPGNDEYTVSPHTDRFRLVVINDCFESSVIVGVRIRVGSASSQHIPKEIRVFNRALKTTSGTSRWYDIPLTDNEILLADKQLTISTGPTYHQNKNNAPLFDALEVYTRGKSEWGYQEKLDALRDSGSALAAPAGASGPISIIERAAVCALEAIGASWRATLPAVSDATEASTALVQALARPDGEAAKLRAMIPKLFVDAGYDRIQGPARRLLRLVCPSTDEYHAVKDAAHLEAMKGYVSSSEPQGTGAHVGFEREIAALRQVCIARPSNVADVFVSSPGLPKAVVDAFWALDRVGSGKWEERDRTVTGLIEMLVVAASVRAGSDDKAQLGSVWDLIMTLVTSDNSEIRGRSSASLSAALMRKLKAHEEGEGWAFSCDTCDVVRITGHRWHCLVCEDFDQCSKCHDEGKTTSTHRSEHAMERLNVGTTGVVDPDPQEQATGKGGDDDEAKMLAQAVAMSLSGSEVKTGPAVTLVAPAVVGGALFDLAVSSFGSVKGKGGLFVLPYCKLLMDLACALPVSHEPEALAILKARLEQLVDAVMGPGPAKVIGDEDVLTSVRANAGTELDLVSRLLMTVLTKGVPQPATPKDSAPATANAAKNSGPPAKVSKPGMLDGACCPVPKVVRRELASVLRSRGYVDAALGHLRGLISAFESGAVERGVAGDDSGGNGPLLRVSVTVVPAHVEPFFNSAHVEATSGNLFEKFPVLVLESVLRFAYALQVPERKQARDDALAREKAGQKTASPAAVYVSSSIGGKSSESTTPSNSSGQLFGDEWKALCCRALLVSSVAPVKLHLKKLLLALSGSKTASYEVRDFAQLARDFARVVALTGSNNDWSASNLAYDDLVSFLGCLSSLLDVASNRQANWQLFCRANEDVVPFLHKALFALGEESALSVLKLLTLAFTAPPVSEVTAAATGGVNKAQKRKKSQKESRKSSSGGKRYVKVVRKKRARRRSGTDDENSGTSASEEEDEDDLEVIELEDVPAGVEDEEQGEDVAPSTPATLGVPPVDSRPPLSPSGPATGIDVDASALYNGSEGSEGLARVVKEFLLASNSSLVRGEARNFIFGLWQHADGPQRKALLTLMCGRLEFLPAYGKNGAEFTELLTYMVSSDEGSAELGSFVSQLLKTLREQNELLANHPHSHLYRSLASVLEFDGYYLESEPCLVCNDPEVPHSLLRLDNMSNTKNEVRFTEDTHVIKFKTAYSISGVSLVISELRRTQMVKTINLYYNSKSVESVSDLRNNWGAWKKAKTISVPPMATEVQATFAIPLTANNFLIEYAEFHENMSVGVERLTCPRCSQVVTDYKHGFCRNCPENAYQCRQCRNVNFDNLRAFLCVECGYCKHAKFSWAFMAKPSLTASKIETDEDRSRAQARIDKESEAAHARYTQLMNYKRPLAALLTEVPTGGADHADDEGSGGSRSSSSGSGKVSRRIQVLAELYGHRCKDTFDALSKNVQVLMTTRKELVRYLDSAAGGGAGSGAGSSTAERPANRCFGCANAFVSQILGLVEQLAKSPKDRAALTEAGLIEELFTNNLSQGTGKTRVDARRVLCALVVDNSSASARLNEMLSQKLQFCLEAYRSLDLGSATQSDMALLTDLAAVEDSEWESRLRMVMELFFRAIEVGSSTAVIAEYVILPCLKIMTRLCVVQATAAEAASKQMQAALSAPRVGYENWVNGEASYDNWAAEAEKAIDQDVAAEGKEAAMKSASGSGSGSNAAVVREVFLASKFGSRWKSAVFGGGLDTDEEVLGSFVSQSWIKVLLLSPVSRAVRVETAKLVETLCVGPLRTFRFLDMMTDILGDAVQAGEAAAEYWELYGKLTEPEDRKCYLAVRGWLTYVSRLIGEEIGRISAAEGFYNTDIAQGTALHKLLQLLRGFLAHGGVLRRFKQGGAGLEVLLDGLLSVRVLIVQKTKLIEDSGKILEELIDVVNGDSEEERRNYMAANIKALEKHTRGRTPIFVYEQLCDIVCPIVPEPEYLLNLHKTPSQEEFMPAGMNRNPYRSKEFGSIMRDVKNRICNELGLTGLIEDDNGMELLVANKIIKLDLSIALVYEQVWKEHLVSSGKVAPDTPVGDMPPMQVVYRLQGLDGEATEDIVETLNANTGGAKDPEEEFAIAAVMAEKGGLETAVGRLVEMADIERERELAGLILRLLVACVKIKVVRRAMVNMDAVPSLLGVIRAAFAGDGDSLADLVAQLLAIIASVVQEANRYETPQTPAAVAARPGGTAAASSAGVGASPASTSSQNRLGRKLIGAPSEEVVLSQLSMFLDKLSSPLSRSHPELIESMAHVLPYLTYGKPKAMDTLVAAFQPPALVFEGLDDALGGPGGDKMSSHLTTFVSVVQAIANDENGLALKSAFVKAGVPGALVDYVKSVFPAADEADGSTWREGVGAGMERAGTGRVLSALAGFVRGHGECARVLTSKDAIALLHRLERETSVEGASAAAEDVLEAAIDADGQVADAVTAVREASAAERKRLAMAKREKLLKSLNVKDQGDGKLVAQWSNPEGLEIEDEAGLKCMVCQEGYTFKPQDILGVYTFSKVVSLVPGVEAAAVVAAAAAGGAVPSGNVGIPRGDRGYGTVTHFNLIHFSCHDAATQAEAKRQKGAKGEWAGAELRNSQTRCNGLMPLPGPNVSGESYETCADRFWNNLSNIGRAEGGRFRLVVHDLRRLLEVFAYEGSFSADSHGGGRESNIRILPFMVALGCQAAESRSGAARSSMEKGVSAWLSEASPQLWIRSLDDSDSEHFMLAASLFLMSAQDWAQSRWFMFKRTMAAALMRARAKAESGGEEGKAGPGVGDPKSRFAAVKPSLVVFGLVNGLQTALKGSGGSSGGGPVTSLSHKCSAEWITKMQTKIGSESLAVIDSMKDLLGQLQDEFLVMEDVQEYADVYELLAEFMDDCPSGDGDQWLQSLLTATAVGGQEEGAGDGGSGDKQA